MSTLYVVPIVEGHGEAEAMRTLLYRLWTELLGGQHIEVLRAIRHPRGTLIQEQGLQRAVDLASRKLNAASQGSDRRLILILIDAHDDAPCQLGPQMLGWANIARKDLPIACVLANIEYETWFVAASESLANHMRLLPDEAPPTLPEQQRLGKGWVERRFIGAKYSETVDQPSMTASMDLRLCRTRSPSFDKLCREMESCM